METDWGASARDSMFVVANCIAELGTEQIGAHSVAT